jgi:hypothetical protein
VSADANDQWVGDDRFAHHLSDSDAVELPNAPSYDAETEAPIDHRGRNKNYYEGVERRLRILTSVKMGLSVREAVEKEGVATRTYETYRKQYPKWGAAVTEARVWANGMRNTEWDGSAAGFMATFFNMPPLWFQLLFLQELENTPRGNILLVLWPPEHGKTTTFENYASMKLAMAPAWRFLVASENQGIARKINFRVMNRMNPNGPFPQYVSRFGPFMPQMGEGLSATRFPWTDTKFRVHKAQTSDERNYSMEAVGAGGSIVSARTDHLHVDDPQSTRTLGQTDKLTTWFRQDALSRPAESGVTSVCGTRVGEGDFFEDLLDDPGLDDILKVIRFPAIITDNDTGEQKPLWQRATPDGPGHTLESLDRMRRKVGDEIWDRNWMQNPGASRKGKGTFNVDMVEKCLDETRSLEHHVGDEGERDGSIVYIGLDPALGGKNCITAWEITEDHKMILRRVREDIGFERNEQIMAALESVIRWCNLTGMVTDVVIEDKNFQLGLKNDERMEEMAMRYGFQIRGNMTGWNKYDPDIGVASMATSFIKREIVFPWAADDLTRHEVGEFKRQLYAWKPGVRGNKLRQDRVMTLWFVWQLWRNRHKVTTGLGSHDASAFKRQTGAWTMSDRGLIVPQGAA